jgi:DNA polymerase
VILACRPWLEAELHAVKPRILVCLGATAAQSLLGKSFSVTRQHGKLVDSELAPFAIATMHPSSILRARDAESRQQQMSTFIDDLRHVARLVAKKQLV